MHDVFIRIKYYLIFVLTFYSSYANAQVSPLYSEHIYFEQFVNPAKTGHDKYPVINLSHKQFWIGTNNSPGTTSLGFSMRLGSFSFYSSKGMLKRTGFFAKGRMGFGGLLMHENDGPISSYLLTGNYAYYIPLNYSNTELSLGISLQLQYLKIDQSILEPLHTDDPVLLNVDGGHFIPESGFGVYFHTSQFYAGASINDLLLTQRPYSSNVAPNKRDFFVQTGYKFFFRWFDLEPSLYLAKIDEKQFYYYLQAKLYYKDFNWLALGYKSTQAMHASIGIKVHRIYMAYAFEQSFAEMGSYYGSTHQVLLGIYIGPNPPAGIKKHTRRML